GAEATINGNVLTAISGGGTVRISATAADGSGITQTQIITVKPIAATSITITSSPNPLQVESAVTLTATVSPANASNQNVTWSIQNGDNFASISGNSTQGYVLTGVAPGSVTVVASADGGENITAERVFSIIAKIIISVPVTNINITNADSAMVGIDVNLAAEVIPNNASLKTVSWAISSGNTFATISGDAASGYVLTGILPGEVVITATADDNSGITEIQTFTVLPIPVTAISITSQNSIKHGESVNLNAEITPNTASNQNIIWSIENGNNAFASIQGNIINGLGVGQITIIATAQGGENISARQTFDITEATITEINITSHSAVLEGNMLALTANIFPTFATNQNIIWSIQGGGVDIASIDTSNMIHGIVPGEVILVASAAADANITGTQNFTVTGFTSAVAAPAIIKAVSLGAPNQVIVYWEAVDNAIRYKLYQTTANLSGFVNRNAATLSELRPLPAATSINETSFPLVLNGSAKIYFLVTAVHPGGIESFTIGQQTGGGLGFGKGDDFADGINSAHQHY
ncbi:MAG: hypothetical protein HAW58_03505, partial [Candidatus Thioglobus sp.]|nr:hypothetical protein [Candidatus Thioglobus sp.]